MRNITLLILFPCLFFLNISFSQTSKTCGTYPGYLQDEINKYPNFYQELETINHNLEETAKKLIADLNVKENSSERKIIPVVVHVIHDFGNENVTDADVDYALDQLNKNINRQSDNMLSTPDVFAAVSGSANVEFRLARLDPEGNPTNGIIRVNSTLTDVPQPRDIVKSLSYWNSYSYFNIWVVRTLPDSDGNTLLGYAQFPWSGSMSTDGVVIRSSEFKNGKTLTHEVGHWLGLRHIWGDNTCGDDGVADTPVAKEENWGVNLNDFPYHLNVCVADTINPAGEMFMNYMDYSDDAVMSLFTDGQVEIMNQTLQGDSENYPFRIYLWSDNNLENTGTSDGWVPGLCNKKVEFMEQYGNTTTCLGQLTALKGNKNIFSNVTNVTWDFGDGTTNTSGDNTPQHEYTQPGTYDVTLSINYTDNMISKAYSMNDINQTNATLVETITETKWIEGTMEELNEVNAYDPVLYMDTENYSVELDTLFYRGKYDETYYLAHYEQSCVATITKSGYIKVLPSTSINNNSSYVYSFESSSDFTDNFSLIENNLVSEWDFNIKENTSWEIFEGVSSLGSASLMLNGRKLNSNSSIVFETESYDLSNFSQPAITFDYIGAASNSNPSIALVISYSDECGVWKELCSLDSAELTYAGFYSEIYTPNMSNWNDTLLYDRIGSNDLKSPNIRFKFEINSNQGGLNRLYIDNIRIGEELDLLKNNQETLSKVGLALYPNPVKGRANILFETTSQKNNIDLKLFNILGLEVISFSLGNLDKGLHFSNIELTSLESGVYFVSILSEGNVLETIKVVIE